jgi:hypothetical protein
MLQDKQAKEGRQKERHWACLHRLKKKGVALVAGGGVERWSAGLSRSTRHDITWPVDPSYTIPGGTTGVLSVMVMPYHLEHRWGCLRPCRRLRRAPARHTHSVSLIGVSPIGVPLIGVPPIGVSPIGVPPIVCLS